MDRSSEENAPIFELEGQRATVRLNRPSRHNRVEMEDIAALNAILDDVESNADIRALVLTGTGETFCSGFDLTVFIERAKAGRRSGAEQQAFAKLCDRFEDLPLPTVCAINGSVYGGAIDLALACDFRVGVDGARMHMPAGALGIHYYPTGLRRYVTRLGLSAAKRVVLAGETFKDAAMAAIGFLDEIVPTDELMERANARADALVRSAPEAYRGMKAILHDIAYAQLDRGAAEAAFLESLSSPELAEGLTAWREKRAPDFPTPHRPGGDPDQEISET